MMDRPHPSPMDSAVVLSILGLIALGLITLARIGLPPSAGMDSQIVRQSVFVLVGIALFTVMAYLDYRAVGMMAWVLFAVSVLLLVLVLFFGVTRYGAQRWFLAGPLQFQPSELAKFTEIILLARFFAKYRGEPIKFRIFALSALIPALPIALTLLQPDFGTAMIFFVIWFGIAFIAGSRIMHSAAVVLLSIAAAPLAWFLMKPYMRERVVIFFDPSIDPLGAGYNVLQARIAVGSGGLWGRGSAGATQSQLEFLRVRDTDFIFAVIAEHLGFVGSMMVLSLFGIIFAYALVVAIRASDDFGRYLAAGVLLLLVFEVFVSIGMNIGIAPVTGITLPLMSSGGSSLVVTLMALGALISVSIHRGVPMFNRPTRVGLPARARRVAVGIRDRA